uniref:Uncharacterized protein n=1 Tax=Musa acuminata subsp. malaccensis TaxID=214687 RepID=A0A804L6H1_MUSAM
MKRKDTTASGSALTPFRLSSTPKDATSGSALNLVPKENFI